MTTHAAVRVGTSGDVVTITLSNPERRNALTASMLEAMLVALSGAGEARAIVVTGEPPAFCAGADLSSARVEEFQTSLLAVLDALVASPVPVVAAVDGAAFGAGMQLVAACDLRVATPTSRFAIPAARLGLVVEPDTVALLTRALGDAVARDMLLAAGSWSAERLASIGFVHRLGDVSSAVEWAREVASLAPLSHAGHKAALRGDVALAGDARRRAATSVDAVEGRAAFSERRRPRFVGR
jgi:enoyl-CoA hydratase